MTGPYRPTDLEPDDSAIQYCSVLLVVPTILMSLDPGSVSAS